MLALFSAPFFEVSLDAEKSEHQFQLRISLPVRRFDTEFSEFFDTVYCKNKYTQTVNDAIVNGIPSLDISEEYSKYTNCLVRQLTGFLGLLTCVYELDQ